MCVVSCRILVVDDFEPWRRSAYSMLDPNQEFEVIGEASYESAGNPSGR